MHAETHVTVSYAVGVLCRRRHGHAPALPLEVLFQASSLLAESISSQNNTECDGTPCRAVCVARLHDEGTASSLVLDVSVAWKCCSSQAHWRQSPHHPHPGRHVRCVGIRKCLYISVVLSCGTSLFSKVLGAWRRNWRRQLHRR